MKVRAKTCLKSKIPPVVRMLKHCRQCGEWFIGTPKGVYCSKECCHKYLAKHQKPRDRKNEKRSQPKPRGPFVCHYCHKEYMTIRSKGEGEIFCGRDCSYAHRHENAISLKQSVVHFKKCKICLSSFISRNKQTRSCSDDCRKIYNRNKAHIRNKEQHKSESRVHKCTICSTPYCLVYGTKQLKYCSDECYKQSTAYENYQQQKRISRTYWNHRNRVTSGHCEHFSPFEIFDRDKWRCQACFVKTLKRLRGTYKDNAPELDHIVPLSKGGSHTRTNVRLSCRKCNGSKGNGALNDQLLLIG